MRHLMMVSRVRRIRSSSHILLLSLLLTLSLNSLSASGTNQRLKTLENHFSEIKHCRTDAL